MIFKQTFGEIKCPSLQYSSDYERHQDSKLLKSAVNLSDEVSLLFVQPRKVMSLINIPGRSTPSIHP